MTPASFDKSVAVTRLSIAAPRIEILGEDGAIMATASAGFYQGEDGRYLVSNWHNFSGVDPTTKCLMPGWNGYPAKVRIIGRHMFDAKWNVPHQFEVPLRDPVSGLFVWCQHPTFGGDVDVGALRLPDKESASVVCCNEDLEPFPVIKCPGDEVFVLGYPLNISGGLNYPLWKRASIASEPSEDIYDKPMFLIDTASRKGMSGAPVFYRSHAYLTEGSELAVGNTAQLFYGIYSGRLPEPGDNMDDPIAAQLGLVWKPKAISEVVACGVSPSF